MPQELAKNIKVDGTGYPYPGGTAQYESEIKILLVKLEASQTGKALIPLLATAHFPVTIIPLTRGLTLDLTIQSPAPSEVTAFTATPGGEYHHTYARNAPRRRIDGSIDANEPKGMGLGAATTIEFTPTYFQNREGVSPDCVLLHELVHALRNVRGTVQREPVSRGWENSEELLSIFVENMYRSEIGQPLRISHLIKKGVRMTPNHLMRDNPHFHQPMEQARNELPDLFNAMAVLASLSYNPFKDFLEFTTAKIRNIRAILDPIKPAKP